MLSISTGMVSARARSEVKMSEPLRTQRSTRGPIDSPVMAVDVRGELSNTAAHRCRLDERFAECWRRVAHRRQCRKRTVQADPASSSQRS